MSTETDWLEIKPKRGRKKKEVAVAAGAALTFDRKRAAAMQGTSRIWACDGEYVFFRPTRVVDGVKTVVANPTTLERHNRYLAQKQYEYVGTQDDVEVYKVLEGSAFARKGLYVGELSDAEVRRQVVKMACARDWVGFVDCLEELSSRLKARYDSAMAKTVYGEWLSYIDYLVTLRGGPTAAERAAGLSSVRERRGDGKGRIILLPGGAPR